MRSRIIRALFLSFVWRVSYRGGSMVVRLFFLVVGLGICGALQAKDAEGAERDLTVKELRAALQTHLGAERFERAAWGIEVVSLKTGAVLFETHAHKLLKPASTAKLFTAALALDALGPDFRIRTSLYSPAAPDGNGTLRGDLVIYGRGDPSFAARFQGGSYTNLLVRVVDAVRAAGLRRIEGDLIGDDTFFSGPHFGAGWTWDDLGYYYGAEVSALTYQDNVIDLTLRPGAPGEPCRLQVQPATDYVQFFNQTRTETGRVAPGIEIHRPLGENRAWIFGRLPQTHSAWVDSVTVSRPAQWFAESLKQALAAQGIIVAGQARSRSWPETGADVSRLKELGHCDSPPLSEILEKMLKPSQNLYAQLLWLQAGAQTGKTGVNTEDLGQAAMRAFLRREQIDSAEVQLEEGSGLSRTCLVTPHAMAQLLRQVSTSRNGSFFRQALPEPGSEGTLRYRLPELKGKLHAKTGSYRFVSTLAGYLTSRAGEELAFSIMLNAYSGPKIGREEVDVIPRLLYRLSSEAR